MTRSEAIHDLNALIEFFEQEANAVPICLEYAVKELSEENGVDDDRGLNQEV